VLSQIYLSAGYDCLEAGDGQEGLALFKASRPPLTVTDLKMPVMDGIQLVAAVRALDQDAAVVVLTGAPDVRTAIESLKLGASDFIMKPVNVEELLIASDRALERRQLLIERRQYQELLERRVEEATRDVQLAYRQLKDTYRATLESLGAALDSRDVGTESHSAASTATPWPPRAPTGCRKTSWPILPTASCSTTSARSGFPTPSCSSRGRSPRTSGRSCARTRRSAGA